MSKTAILCFMVFAALLFAQGENPREIPPFEGDGNSQHEGQPQFCQAEDRGGFKKNCGICDTMCGPDKRGQEDPKCKVFCRAGACRCHLNCNTMNMGAVADPVNLIEQFK